MSTFDVTVRRTRTQEIDIAVEAKNEEEAKEIVEYMWADFDWDEDKEDVVTKIVSIEGEDEDDDDDSELEKLLAQE